MIWDLINFFKSRFYIHIYVFFFGTRSANISAEFIIGMSRNPLCRKLFRTIFRTDSSPSSTIFPMQLSELMANRLEREGK